VVRNIIRRSVLIFAVLCGSLVSEGVDGGHYFDISQVLLLGLVWFSLVWLLENKAENWSCFEPKGDIVATNNQVHFCVFFPEPYSLVVGLVWFSLFSFLFSLGLICLVELSWFGLVWFGSVWLCWFDVIWFLFG
jgi:hypothetical protein